MAIAASSFSELVSPQRDSWRRFRDLIAPVLSLRISRAIRRGDPVVIGSWNRPFESLAERRALLDQVPEDRSLVIRLRCKSRSVLSDLPRLIQLDQQHDLSVEWLVDRPRRLGWSRTALEAAGQLAAEGIRVRLIWRASDHWEASDVEAWVAEARKLRVWDICCESDRDALVQRFQVLRLEYGFPLFAPGRG